MRVRRVLVLLAPTVIIGGAGAALFTIASRFAERDGWDIVQWHDAETGNTYVVTETSRVWHNFSELAVHDGEQSSRVQIDDDITLSTVRLVLFEHWLLVINGEHVLAGHDRKTGRLLGEYDWQDLPFTAYQGQGAVVAVGQGRGSTERPETPIGYPLTHASGPSP